MALSVAVPQVPAWELAGLGSLGSPRTAAPHALSCLRTGRRWVSEVWSHPTCYPHTCLRPSLLPWSLLVAWLEGCSGIPQLPRECSFWLCNLHQLCSLKHYWPMQTVPPWVPLAQRGWRQPVHSSPAPRTPLFPRQHPMLAPGVLGHKCLAWCRCHGHGVVGSLLSWLLLPVLQDCRMTRDPSVC